MLEQHLKGFADQQRILYGLSPRSVESYLSKLREFIAWAKGNDYPSGHAFTREDIEAYLTWCFRRGNQNITRNTKLTALKKFFRYLVYTKVMHEDITADIPRPRTPRRFIQAFTRDDVLRMFRTIRLDHERMHEKALRDVVVLILGAFCGFRIEEAITVSLSAIEDDGKHINIHVRGKGGSDRTVYLWAAPSLFIRSYLSARIGHGAKKDDPLLVSYTNGGRPKGRALTRGAVDWLIKRLAGIAGLRKPEVHYHMFRAGHINDLQHVKGYTLPAIAKRVGHRHISTTDLYIKNRERIHREYSSLAAYWKDFGPKLWEKGEHDVDGSTEGGTALVA